MRRTYWLVSGVVSLGTLCAAACSSSSGSGGGNLFTGGAGGAGNASGSGGVNLGGGYTGGSGGGIILPDANNTGGGGGGGTSCTSGPDEDKDKDGFSVNQGDCNDCDPNVNPGAIDVMHQADPDGGPDAAQAGWGDEDCSGTPGDSAPVACDTGLALDDQDPFHAANSIELCQTTTDADKKWGVISANWVRADGSPYPAPGLQVGIQPDFGPNVHPQGGKTMLNVSSGYARTPSEPGACGGKDCSAGQPDVSPPPGFPQDSGSCAGGTDIHDDVALELKLRAPTNAVGYSFNFRFYSFEYPEWVCTTYNDQFIALVNPPPTGAMNGNICFDANGKPVSVNVAFFQVCTGCPAGNNDLIGTGFDLWDNDGITPPLDNAGGTVWLSTQAPVKGGDVFTIRFTIWDTGDTLWDSSALIDNFQWIANAGNQTVTVGTQPVPVPK